MWNIRDRIRLIGISFCLFLIVGIAVVHPKSVFADTLSITSGSDWAAGTLSNTDTTVSEGTLRLKSDGSWGARSWRTPNLPFYIGSAFASDGTEIYAARGLGDVLFWKYTPTTDTWTSLANMPRGVYYGAELEVLGDYVYALFGGYQTAFARYSISNDSWEMLENLPDLVNEGGSLETDGTDIYALRGNVSQDFYKYDVSEDSWSPLAGTPATVRRGADLVRVGNYIYTPRGNNTNTFYRYDIVANTWSTMANVPGTMYDDVEISTNGTEIFVTRQNNTASFYSYSIAGNSWSTLTNLPGLSRYAGSIYNSADGYVYVFQGNNQYNFWKYNPTTGAFLGPEDVPSTVNTGGDLVYYSGYIYAARGTNTATFYRLNLATNAWENLANAPANFNDDTKGVAAGSYLYFFRGSNTATFYRYAPATNTWTTMTDAPAAVRFGGSLAYPGSGNYLYATRGATTTSFWRYDISGDSWDDLGAADLPTDTDSSYGARLISDGSDIYYLAGIGISRWLKYTIGTDTWSELSRSPFAPYYGTDIAYSNGKVLAIAGSYKTNVWEYTIATDSWKKLESVAGYQAQDLGPYTGASIEYDGSGSFYVSRGGSKSNLLIYTPGSNNFLSSGSWTSGTYSLGYVSSWTSFAATTITPTDSAISYETRTSSDGTSWDSWAAVSGSTIASTPQPYLQIRATLLASTGSSDTPILQDIAIDYVGDTGAPTNPDTVEAASQEVSGTTLTDGGTYRYINPYFSWSGAADSETSIAGYYVYFGVNNAADPETTGEYQTDADYISTKVLATGTYYLRIQTKDTAGNLSAATTIFTYNYNGISPAQSLTVTDSVDFTGTASNTAVTGDQIELASKSNGFWLEETLSSTPGTMQYGAKNTGYVESSNTLYAFRGNNSATFYAYDLDSDTWSTLANAPGNVRMGGGVIEGPEGYLYGLQGNNTTSFWRYDIGTDTWSDAAAADAPLTVYYGGSLVYDNSRFIYVLRGNNDDAFWRYDTQVDGWESLPATDFGATANAVTNTVYNGGDLAIDQTNEIVYATQGNIRDGFAAFNINTNQWTVLADLPQLPQNGSTIDYAPSDNQVYFIPGYNSDKLFAYDVATDTWSQKTPAPVLFNYGTSIRNIGNYLYTIQGGNTTGFYKFDLTKNSWLIPNRGIFGTEFQGTNYISPNYGADIVKGDNNYFYLIRGNYSDDFIRWNSETGATVELTNAPVGTTVGSSLVYDNTNDRIYLTGGAYLQKFFYYDIATDTWSEESADPPPIDTNYGTSMVYDGSQYIYMNRGAATTNFYRFDTQGTSGAKWTTLTSPPAGLGYGAELLLNGGYIYSLRGQNVANNPFYRYDIGANTWSDPAVADLNVTIYNDGFLADGGDGNFYAARGANDTSFFKYSVSDNTWTTLDNAPARIYQGGSGESNGTNKLFMLTGSGTGSYQDAIYTYVMSTSDSGFEESGNYTSQTHDLTSVYKWANLTITYQSATNTTLSIQTRSSADASTWSSWTAVNEEQNLGTTYTYQIKSPANRYLQVKFDLASTNGIYSSVISDYTINYYKDTTAPSNPETAGLLSYSDDSLTDPIVTNTWYGHSDPFFDWPDAEATNGATDTSTGSGVTGYYVYFGTNVAADPYTDGVLQTTSDFTASSLVSGNTYYLLVKTLDDAGNISASTWQPFIYKYDGEPASAPENLSADPSGYSSTNSFDFSWDVATSSGALVSSYCYKTATTSGTFSTDQCTTDTSITAIPAYKVGTNTFSVRSKDAAGNYSAYSSVLYYYVDSANAPAPPLNLVASPSTNTENSFAFSWDPPAVGTYYGSLANLSYRYSINALPTAQSTSSTSLRYLLAGAYATLPGENTLYIVTKDEAGNINYSNYSSVTFTANTTAPGIPLNMDIADVSVKSTSSWKLALSWEAPEGSLNVSTYQIYRSIDGETFSSVASSGGISFVDVGLVQQIYYYQVKACDNTNNCGAVSEIVSLYPDGKFTTPAELIADPVVSSITTKKANISWSTGRTADSKIAYGTSSGSYFDEEVANSDQVTSHALNLTNLSPGTTYYFVAKWTDEDGNTGVSEEQTFDTSPPPSTEEPVAKSIGLDSALIEFTSKNATKIKIYYGETSAFGGITEISTGISESVHTVELSDLKDGTKYFYKINSYDSEDEEYEGEIHSFTTLPRPKISNIQINQVKGTAQSTLLITWDTNTGTSSIVTYYPLTNPALAQDEVDITYKTGRHQVVLVGLLPQTTYGLLVKGKDVVGNEAVGELQQVSTSADTRPPLISDLRVEGEIIGSGEEATAQLVVSYDTDEPATSQVEFGEGSGATYSQKTQEDSSPTNHHSIVISELLPAKVYHLRAISKDEFGNEAQSIDKVVVTPNATANALDLVISNMSSIFGFLSQ